MSRVISKKIQNRTKNVIDTIKKEWHNYWWQFINSNLDKDLNWYEISRNPNLTMKDILDNPDKPWDWKDISCNEFTKEKEQFIEKKYRKHIAAILIQNAYKNALVNPNCKIGINKIKRDMVDVGIIE